MNRPRFSIIVPCRNEAAQIAGTLDAIARARWTASPSSSEVIVVANGCTDGTLALLARRADPGLSIAVSRAGSAPAARNEGARLATGEVLVFVDADTHVPAEALRALEAHMARGYKAGIFALGPQEDRLRARLFFAFWNQVRRLPVPRAKAMPAFMFVTREAFDGYGPFDESCKIGEEWPILAGLYRSEKGALVYDRDVMALTSSRRMELRRFGYARVLLRYAWAIVHESGRMDYPDTLREDAAPRAGPP